MKTTTTNTEVVPTDLKEEPTQAVDNSKELEDYKNKYSLSVEENDNLRRELNNEKALRLQAESNIAQLNNVIKTLGVKEEKTESFDDLADKYFN